ncbi:putative 2-dehydropantoate 2-reductase [Exophiala viscosa]|uniref:2-dehydropantoate 2-reductase n=1 Tax=Exophiala viscosa TaxID=2486360 RepID=A0AAN6DX12_9EURO|nr:putative 2-dehydropantoate 2-reductase [Exophiala viscosa]
MISQPTKANVLLVGSGGVGTMGAYALETGGKAEVTAVLRSNFDVVSKQGFFIDSIEHGNGIEGWKPTKLVNKVPNVAEEGIKPFDFIVVTTKNVPDVKPTVSEIIEPAVTPGHTVIVLVQNGLNIEKPVVAKYPSNAVLSGVSLIGATETSHGKIRHDDSDAVKVGPYKSPDVSLEESEKAAKEFVDIYNACGKVDAQFDTNVPFTRWRKLIYNSSFNSVATILRMDTTRMRISEHVIDTLIRPAMLEIKATAKAAGVELPEDIAEVMIRIDPKDTFFKPSMCQDIEKGNYIEFENIVGEPMREAEKLGVATPVLKTIYGILKGLQWKTMEAKGLVVPKWHEGSLYG